MAPEGHSVGWQSFQRRSYAWAPSAGGIAVQPGTRGITPGSRGRQSTRPRCPKAPKGQRRKSPAAASAEPGGGQEGAAAASNRVQSGPTEVSWESGMRCGGRDRGGQKTPSRGPLTRLRPTGKGPPGSQPGARHLCQRARRWGLLAVPSAMARPCPQGSAHGPHPSARDSSRWQVMVVI